MEADLIAKGVVPESAPWPERTKRWFLGHGGGLDPVTGKLVHGTKLKRATERLIQILKARDSGLFRPNREKDELTYSIGTAEHCGQTRGKGVVPLVQGFPEWIDSYRSRQRRKDEEAERIRILQQYVIESREAVLESQRREKEMQAKMQEEVARQVQIQLSAHGITTALGINISRPDQLRSSCASTELPDAIKDAELRFPVDDVTEPFTSCELHIPKDNGTVKVAIGVVNPIDRTKTPRIHGAVVPAGYATVSVDKAIEGFSDVPLDIHGGDGEKTVGEAEKSFIAWRKRYINIPGKPLPHNRYG